MTTIDGVPGLREYTGMWLVNVARNRKRAKAARMSTTPLLAFVRVMLHLAGFALLTIMGFEINNVAGYAVAGISCFVMATLMSGSEQTNDPTGKAPDLRTGR